MFFSVERCCAFFAPASASASIKREDGDDERDGAVPLLGLNRLIRRFRRFAHDVSPSAEP